MALEFRKGTSLKKKRAEEAARLEAERLNAARADFCQNLLDRSWAITEHAKQAERYRIAGIIANAEANVDRALSKTVTLVHNFIEKRGMPDTDGFTKITMKIGDTISRWLNDNEPDVHLVDILTGFDDGRFTVLYQLEYRKRKAPSADFSKHWLDEKWFSDLPYRINK